LEKPLAVRTHSCYIFGRALSDGFQKGFSSTHSTHKRILALKASLDCALDSLLSFVEVLLSQEGEALSYERTRPDGVRMNSQIICSGLENRIAISRTLDDRLQERRWYAVFILPQNEKAAVKHLDLRNVESFLPTYETIRVWKNRQRVKTVLPLFPSYLFVRINPHERVKVLQTPGVLHVVGNGRQCVPLEDSEIEFIRSGLLNRKPKPYHELVIGERVRIRSGMMQGVEGVLVRKNSSLRFVLSLKLINQHAAVEIDADSLESLLA
jgi:transcription antitermination factor NusG